MNRFEMHPQIEMKHPFRYIYPELQPNIEILQVSTHKMCSSTLFSSLHSSPFQLFPFSLCRSSKRKRNCCPLFNLESSFSFSDALFICLNDIYVGLVDPNRVKSLPSSIYSNQSLFHHMSLSLLILLSYPFSSSSLFEWAIRLNK